MQMFKRRKDWAPRSPMESMFKRRNWPHPPQPAESLNAALANINCRIAMEELASYAQQHGVDLTLDNEDARSELIAKLAAKLSGATVYSINPSFITWLRLRYEPSAMLTLMLPTADRYQYPSISQFIETGVIGPSDVEAALGITGLDLVDDDDLRVSLENAIENLRELLQGLPANAPLTAPPVDDPSIPAR
jgi:hypothetical protein